MALTMYQASIPVMTRAIRNLQAILAKGAQSAEERKIDASVFISARLAPDMLPLNRQVYIVSDTAKGAAARLAGVEVPSWPDTETTFPDLHARLEKTVDYLKGFTPAQIDGTEEKAISLKFGPRQVDFSGQGYLFGFVLPNLYFHVSIAHAILRHNGVNIGKMDYLGGA